MYIYVLFCRLTLWWLNTPVCPVILNFLCFLMCFLPTWSWTQRGAFSSYNVNKERKKKDSHPATERDRKGEAGKNQAWSWATTTTQRWEKAPLTLQITVSVTYIVEIRNSGSILERAFASHQCPPSSSTGVDALCGCWLSSLLQEFCLWVSLKNQHFQIIAPPGKCLQTVGDTLRAIHVGLSVCETFKCHHSLIKLHCSLVDELQQALCPNWNHQPA